MFFLATVITHLWYPPECCGERHCRPVPCEELIWRDEYIYYGPNRGPVSALHVSPDGACHVCVDPFKPMPDRVLCIFAPRGMS